MYTNQDFFKWERLLPGQIQKIQKEGTKFPNPPPPQLKLYFSGHATYSIVGVFVMQSKVTLTFRKIVIKEHFIK